MFLDDGRQSDPEHAPPGPVNAYGRDKPAGVGQSSSHCRTPAPCVGCRICRALASTGKEAPRGPHHKPLIVFTPKSMLRLKAAASKVEEFTTGG
ncbi:hypothetical protein, partial [Streptomyces sp. 900116325]